MFNFDRHFVCKIGTVFIITIALMLSSCGKNGDNPNDVKKDITETVTEFIETKAKLSESVKTEKVRDNDSTSKEKTSENTLAETAEVTSVSDKAKINDTANTQDAIAIGYAQRGISSGLDTYKANCPGIVAAEFVVLDTEHSYDTGFECWLEVYDKKNKSWSKLKPLGEIEQENNGSGHFYNIDESGRNFAHVDLACYPLLPSGSYRIAKPFWEQGNPDREQYIAYYNFEMKDNLNTGSKIMGGISCSQSEYPANTKQIKLEYDGIFSQSNIFDIERKDGGVWKSVRKGGIRTNSIGGSYGLNFSDVIKTDNFDLSKAGEYRMRLSVGEMSEDLDFLPNYDTKYAYFKISDSADMGSISISCVSDDICEIDKNLQIKVKSFVNREVTLKKAVLSVEGKNFEGEGSLKIHPNRSAFNFYDPSTYDSNSIDETFINFKENLPVGNAELKLTFSSDSCKDKTVTAKFNIRKATTEEKNSGVFVTAENCKLSPDTITVSVTNKCRSKSDIQIFNGQTMIYTVVDGKEIYTYMYDKKIIGNQSNYTSTTVKYGETVKFEFVNCGKDLDGFIKLYWSFDDYDNSEEDKEIIEAFKQSIKENRHYEYSCLAKAGTYNVTIIYSIGDEYRNQTASGAFNVK